MNPNPPTEPPVSALDAAAESPHGVENDGAEPHAGLRDEGAASSLFATGGAVSAVLASSCCILPLALVGLGIGGAWMTQLTALAPYQPVFIGIALAFLAAGFWMVYIRPRAARADGRTCGTPPSHRIVKIVLWSATVLIALTLSLPLWAPILL